MRGEVARLFDAMAGSYEELEPWYEHLYAVLHAILQRELAAPADGRRRRALDAGCGTGFQAARLAALGYASHGVDVSAGLLAVARQRLDGAPLALARVEALPYRDVVFDAVACCGSTLSFVDDPAGAVREIGRVLRPGGLLLLECEHRGSLDLAWALVSGLTGDPLGYGVSARDAWRAIFRRRRQGAVLAYPGYGPLRLFTLAEVRGLLEGAGLSVAQTWGIHSVTNLIPSTTLHRARLAGPLAALYRPLRALDAALSGWAPARHLANSLVVLARKPPA